MPRVSIIVPAYNADRFLAATLDSVMASTWRDFEVVVIDDGSTDGTAALVQQYPPPVRLLRQTNRGMSASRNRGILESDAEFIALLDADDLWHPMKLALQIECLEANPQAGVCFTEFFSWDGMQPPPFEPVSSGILDARLSGWIYHQMILTNFVLPSSALMPRRAFAKLGPFLCENQKTDDWEFFVRASQEFEFRKLAARLVAYRQTPQSLSKRVSEVNETEAMREALMARFGLRSPQGPAVDAAELARRQRKSRRDFADMHVARGNLFLGLTGFLQLLARGPDRSAVLACLMRSAARRAIGP
jgi:glycosyltransferase involved in cell wall biosynthesis